MKTEKDLIKWIKTRKKQGLRFNFLRFVENQKLSDEVKSYFTCKNFYGVVAGYDWVNGNQKLKDLIEKVVIK